jgi:hypothetical protein
MSFKSSSFSRAHWRRLAAVVLVATSVGSAQATVTIVNTPAAFNAAVGASGSDGFIDLSTAAQTPGPLARAAGAFGYTASTSISTFYGVPADLDAALSSNYAEAVVTFSGFGADVLAVGGNFFSADIDGLAIPGTLVLTAIDIGGNSASRTLVNADAGSFVGFVSELALFSVTLQATQPSPNLPVWAVADNLVLGSALAAVPEPFSGSLMLAGLVSLAFLTRRRSV